MNRTLVALCLLVPSTVAAQPRVEAQRLSCAQLAGIVRSSGAVIIGTGGFTFDRYVSSGQFCIRPEVPVPAWIAAADTAQCYVGSVCRERQPFLGR